MSFALRLAEGYIPPAPAPAPYPYTLLLRSADVIVSCICLSGVLYAFLP